MMLTGHRAADFEDALEGLEHGDISRLEPLFVPDKTTGKPCQMPQWHREGSFKDQSKALSEALTCACFLGRVGRGVRSAPWCGSVWRRRHWLECCSLGRESGAIHEPRGVQLLVIEELVKTGARLAPGAYPTGRQQMEAILRPYDAAKSGLVEEQAGQHSVSAGDQRYPKLHVSGNIPH